MGERLVSVVINKLGQPFTPRQKVEDDEISLTTTAFVKALDTRDGARCIIPRCAVDLPEALDYCHIVPRMKRAIVCPPSPLIPFVFESSLT